MDPPLIHLRVFTVVDYTGADDLDDLPLNVLAVTADVVLHVVEQIHNSFEVVPLGEVVALAATGTARHELRIFIETRGRDMQKPRRTASGCRVKEHNIYVNVLDKQHHRPSSVNC